MIKNYSPEAPDHVLYNLLPFESKIREIRANTELARWEAVEQLLPQLQGKNWVEANGFAQVYE